MVSVSLSLVINQLRNSLSNGIPFGSFLVKTKTARQPTHQEQQDNQPIYTTTPCKNYKSLVIYASRYKLNTKAKNKNNDKNMANNNNGTNSDTFFTYDKTQPGPTTNQQQYSGLNMPVTPHYIAPRNPIALCHGLYGFDKRGPDAIPFLQVHYWGGIEQALAKLGANVIVTRVPRTGSIWERAQVLHTFMNTVLQGQQVNFIAHSMGGLDCRYLLSHIHDRRYKPISLTTVSTPHLGSPVMDWFRDNIGLGVTGAIKTAVAKKMEQNERLETNGNETPPGDHLTTPASLSQQQQQHPFLNWSLSDIAKMPISLLDPVVQRVVQLLDTPAYANLTTDYCQNYFNPNTPDDPRVAYYSYGASTTIPVWSFLGLPNQWVREKEGDNDGLVSVKSAKWGQYIKTLNTDHWSLNGQRYKWRSSSTLDPKLDKFDTVEFYMELATHLYHQGH